jgi:hypothetical protein
MDSPFQMTHHEAMGKPWAAKLGQCLDAAIQWRRPCIKFIDDPCIRCAMRVKSWLLDDMAAERALEMNPVTWE